MSRAVVVAVLCLIVLAPSACARRSARTAGLSVAPGTPAAEKSARTRDSGQAVRHAIKSLEDRLATDPRAGESPTDPSLTVVPHGTKTGDPKQVGTGGVWSVETRRPLPGASSGDAGPPSKGQPLSRAGQAVRHAVGGTWAGVVALCVVAAALVAALLFRRARVTSGT
jgi:hypothetical protein